MELSRNISNNKHVIKSVKGKLLFYKPIYVQIQVELETLKIKIETYLKNGFI